jgi:hypothetical protein
MAMPADSLMPADKGLQPQVSLADLFLQASRSLAHSDARLYRSVDRHLSRTREILRQAETATGATPQELATPCTPLLLGAPSYERQTRKSLQSLCRQHGVRGYSRMSKALMIQRLQQEGVAAPPVPMEALSKAELLSLLRDCFRDPEQDG